MTLHLAAQGQRKPRPGFVPLLTLSLMGLIGGCGDSPPRSPISQNPPIAGDPSYHSTGIDKIDLLIVVDNSPSMAPKQAALAAALPELIQGISDGVCVDSRTGQFVSLAEPFKDCPAGTVRTVISKDIHIGVLSTSLGGQGAKLCSPGSYQYNPHQQDMGQLLTRGPGGTEVDTGGLGFLAWTPANSIEVTQSLQELILGAGEDGCSYEAPLEAWYRFLVDPKPYEKLVPAPCSIHDSANSCRTPQGIDATVLRQRADFLRPDSIVFILLASDENDCSLKVEGPNSLLLDSASPPQGTLACASNPWSPACKPCDQVSLQEHPECAQPPASPELHDSFSLRCWEQKRRFGIDELYPLRRYVEALTEPILYSNADHPYSTPFIYNPLFCTQYGQKPSSTNPSKFEDDPTECMTQLRDPRMVHLIGLTGVPWQDLARNPLSIKDGNYSAQELAWTVSQFQNSGKTPPPGVDDAHSLWDVILGRQMPPDAEQHPFELIPIEAPLDPLMVESVLPRTGINPATGAPLASPSTPPGTQGANPINGFEHPAGPKDLQYACISELPEPIDCEHASGMCLCHESEKNPLCWNAKSKAYEKKQFRTPVYPARRQLAVVRALHERAIPVSLCTSTLDTSQAQAPEYGYRPAIHSILTHYAESLRSLCDSNEQLGGDKVPDLSDFCNSLEKQATRF